VAEALCDVLDSIETRSSAIAEGPHEARDYEGSNCTFLYETAKIGISHQICRQIRN